MPNDPRRELSRPIVAARSAGFMAWSVKVISAMRRDHSRTLPCKTKCSRSWAISNSPVACASSTASAEAAISLPNSDWGHTDNCIASHVTYGSAGFDADANDITLAVDGLDDLRSARGIAEDLPQPADPHVDAAVERIGLAAPQQLGELGSREHAVGGGQQHGQQAVFGAAQGDRLARSVDEVAGRRVEPPAVEHEAAHAVGARLTGRMGGPAQHRLDAAEQLARIERLGDVVVGAELESDNAVHILAARGEHDDGHLRAAAHVAAYRQAVLAREHEIEHQQIDARAPHHAPHFLAVCNRRRAQLVALQVLTEQQTDLAVIVDDQDVRKLVHRASRSATKVPELATFETTIRALAARARARVTLAGCNNLFHR